MNYKKIESGNYTIHSIKTDKFKKTTIKFYFRQPILDIEEQLRRDILCNVLILGTKNYPSKRDLSIKCEDLFGANLSINHSKSGNYHIFSITISYLDTKYTMENTAEESISFLKEILFNPKVNNKQFDEELVEMAKRMYLDDIASTPDNPSYFSGVKMRNLVDKKSNYAFHPYYYQKEITKITAKDLYKSYQDILNNSELDIAIIGDFDDKLLDSLTDIPVKSNNYDISVYEDIKLKNKPTKKIEEGDYNQSKIAIAYQALNLTEQEKLYTMYIFSFILGGSSDSLIFKKLRLENSLCYYADSSYLLFYQMLEIFVGLESENYDLAIKLIKEAINELIDGKFDEDLIKKAQITYENAWKEIMDNQASIINMYLSKKYYNLALIDERIKEMNKITKKDIMEVGKKIKLNTIYLLKGTNEYE